MKIHFLYLALILLLATACEDLNITNRINPDREKVIATGSDMMDVLTEGYTAWWEATHNPNANIALGVAGDGYALGHTDFGANRMGQEPRVAFSNRISEAEDYRNIAETPWFKNLAAVANANDVLFALDNGVSIDDGGPQDEAITAAAHLLRGLSWGYLGLIFNQGLLVKEDTDLNAQLDFVNYEKLIEETVAELELAIAKSETAGENFIHSYFNGVVLDAAQFQELCHSYVARFLAQAARTVEENAQTDWNEILAHAENGLSFDFAPLADGEKWTSYHTYTFAETALPPFWVRIDQRLVAALDNNQPARYPLVQAEGEVALTETKANSSDKRLETDFEYFPIVNFDAKYGEWHFSHYKHARNVSQPDFAGDGNMGKMPTFLATDNALLQAEALLYLNRKNEALEILNTGSRMNRGNLPPLFTSASNEIVRQAIFYERAIELFNAVPFGSWLDRRRTGERLESSNVDALGGLQLGTPAQLPVPAAELRIQGMDSYTFGGEEDPQGVTPVFY